MRETEKITLIYSLNEIPSTFAWAILSGRLQNQFFSKCNGQKHSAEYCIKSSGVAPQETTDDFVLPSRQLSPQRDDATRLSPHVHNMLLPNTQFFSKR